MAYLLTNCSRPCLRSSMKSSSNIPSSPRNGSCRFRALPGRGGTTIWRNWSNNVRWEYIVDMICGLNMVIVVSIFLYFFEMTLLCQFNLHSHCQQEIWCVHVKMDAAEVKLPCELQFTILVLYIFRNCISTRVTMLELHFELRDIYIYIEQDIQWVLELTSDSYCNVHCGVTLKIIKIKVWQTHES